MSSALLSVATRCGSRDDFLKLFQRYIDREDGSLFIVSKEPRPLGSRQPFQIKLNDGSIVMRGEAEVVKTFPGEEGGRRGYSVRLLDLDDDSRVIYGELLGRSRSAPPPSRTGKPQALIVEDMPEMPDMRDEADPELPALPDLITPESMHPLVHVEPRPIIEPPPPMPPVAQESVIIDLEASGPVKTPPPDLVTPVPADGLRRVDARDGCELWIAKQDRTDGPPWVRHKRFDPRVVPTEKVYARVQAVARTSHPGLARFLELGAAPDGRPAVLTEWVPGRHVGEVIRRSSELGLTIPTAVAVTITAPAARAMAAIHEAMIFHGCLSPSNVIVGFDGRVVITDLASAVDTIACGAPFDGREDLLALCAAFRDLLGPTAPDDLLDLIHSAESMAELAAGLEGWLGALDARFGAEELSHLMLRLFAPREGPLASGWHVVIGGDPYGPLPYEELLDTMARLYLGDPVRVWHEGLERWAVVLTIPRVMDVVDELAG
jgi:hypothetical protein